MGDETPHWSDDGSLGWAPDAAQAFAPTAPEPAPVRIGPWSFRDDAATEVPAPAPAISTAHLWPWRIAIGAAQGLLFFALFHTRLLNQWPGGDPYLFTALALAGLFVPLLLLEGVGAIALTRLLPFAGMAAGVLVGLGWYHRWRLEGAEAANAGLWLLGLCATALFIIQAFLHGRERSASWRLAYADLFDASWSLTTRLLLWAFLVAWGAALLATAGLSLASGDPMVLMLLALTGALAFHAIASLPRATAMLAQMLVTAAALTLPLATAAALLLISTTLGQGPASLPMLCTALAALIVTIGASHRGGIAQERSGWRAGFEVFAAFLLLILAGIAAWTLDLRASALGWTAARIFALSAVTLFLAYGAGYSAAAVMALAKDGSMRRLEGVNILMGVVLVAACLALASPLADPLRLAPATQAARLELGETQVSHFDFANLATNGGRFGAEALAKLSRSLYPDIARAATAARGPAAPPLPGGEVGSNIAVHSPGLHLPATLLARDWSPVLGVPACLSNPRERCDAWFRDLNGDGRDEILLVSGDDARWWAAVMQADEAGRWSLAGRLASGCGTTLTDLKAGRFDRLSALPGWNELTLAGNRVPAATAEQACSHY
jgi:hypothetical protein